MKALPLLCERLDLRVARMTTWNSGPVFSGVVKILSAIIYLLSCWTQHSNEVHFYFILFIYLFVFVETYNALMKVAVVSANEEISTTELAFGLIRDMMAAGLGKL